MQCRSCSVSNDPDAAFCTQCGNPLSGEDAASRSRKKRLLAALLLLAVLLAIMAVIGYYKFVLPAGVAATVNGEVITRGELDTAVTSASSGAGGPRSEDPAARQRFRSQVLSRLITERIVLQEARRDGVAASREEAAERVRMADDAWVRERMRSASVRIALDEQWSAAGCGCCGNRAGASAGGMQKNCRMAAPSAQ